MSHLTNLKVNVNSDIQTMINSGYTTEDIRVYYERVGKAANDTIRRLTKAWELTVITTQKDVAFFAANTLNYILTNTHNTIAVLNLLDEIGIHDTITNRNHQCLIAKSLADIADEVWRDQTKMNQFKHWLFKEHPHATALNELLSPTSVTAVEA